MRNISPLSCTEIGPCLQQASAGYATVAFAAAPGSTYQGLAIPKSEGRLLTLVIQSGAAFGSVTRMGLHIQGTNDDLSGSPTWTNVKPHASVQSGRWPSISPTILGIAMGSARTPPDGPALTSEQQAIEARRLVRFAANGILNWTIDLERTGYAHHRLVINEIVGAIAFFGATWFKTHMRETGASHPYEVFKDAARPSGFTDAEWAVYLDDRTIPATVPQDSVLQLQAIRAPLRPPGLSDTQWNRLRNGIVEEGLMLQHRPEFI